MACPARSCLAFRAFSIRLMMPGRRAKSRSFRLRGLAGCWISALAAYGCRQQRSLLAAFVLPGATLMPAASTYGPTKPLSSWNFQLLVFQFQCSRENAGCYYTHCPYRAEGNLTLRRGIGNEK